MTKPIINIPNTSFKMETMKMSLKNSISQSETPPSSCSLSGAEGKRIGSLNITWLTLLLLVALFYFVPKANAQQQPITTTTGGVSIALDTIQPDPAAILDVRSADKGVLLPRLSTAQRNNIQPLGLAQNGLLVYDTDKKTFFYWDGKANPMCWRMVISKGCNESSGQAPVGSVIAFTGASTLFSNGLGALNTKVEGWAICDGTTYTTPAGLQVQAPDLRGRFIVGEGVYTPVGAAEELSGADLDYDLGETGGLAKYKLTANESGTAAHDHPLSGTGSPVTISNASISGSTSSAGEHSHTYEVRNSGTSVGYKNISGHGRGKVTDDSPGVTSSAGGHAHNFTGTVTATGTLSGVTESSQPVGAASPHDNRPPYYALIYIMRVY